jgi:hypothetical protein
MSEVLRNKNAYLSGAIEGDSSKTNWRPAVIKELTDRFGINVFDPFADEKQKFSGELRAARERKDYDTMARIAAGFVRKDLAKVDRSDFIIARIAYQEAYLPSDMQVIQNSNPGALFSEIKLFHSKPTLIQVPTTGTTHEIINSDLYKKPTLLVCERGKEWIPMWFYGFIDHKRYMFGSWDELYAYLEDVNAGKHKDDDRWSYCYGTI